MRRAHRAKADDVMARGTSYRVLHTLKVGYRNDMLQFLHRLATILSDRVQQQGGQQRVWLEGRDIYFPCREHALVVAPATAIDKARRSFELEWELAALGPSQLAITT
jgi:hypothetical protein